MVMFASLIGAAAVYARLASAGPVVEHAGRQYGYGSASSSSAANNYGYGGSSAASSTYAAMSMSMSSSSAPPAYTSSSSSSYGSGSSSSSSYGSGSSSWGSGSSGYDSCVQQCVAQFGSPSSSSGYMSGSMSGSSSSSSSYSGSYGSNGVTHTVIVAPTQGVLRYVPFTLNASVGDTVMYIWGANNHTVTKSSELAICNKTSDAPFASGEQNKTFTFSQVVNDTNPTFFYCGTPGHCEKGMFGIINPPNAWGAPTCVSSMMPALASQNPSTQAAMTYMMNATSGNAAAAMWGSSINMASMPNWTQSYIAENVGYTSSFLAMNPGTLTPSGGVNMSSYASGTLQWPNDVAAAVRSGSSSASSSSASPSSTSAPSNNGSKNGAGALSSPRVAVALVAIVAACFAL